jgi:hypothetical protein
MLSWSSGSKQSVGIHVETLAMVVAECVKQNHMVTVWAAVLKVLLLNRNDTPRTNAFWKMIENFSRNNLVQLIIVREARYSSQALVCQLQSLTRLPWKVEALSSLLVWNVSAFQRASDMQSSRLSHLKDAPQMKCIFMQWSGPRHVDLTQEAVDNSN